MNIPVQAKIFDNRSDRLLCLSEDSCVTSEGIDARNISLKSYSQTVEIRASPEAVFDIISQVENFSQYTKLIKSISKIKEKTYHWKAHLGAFPIEWDAVILEEYRPWRFAWHSIKGFQNSGSYTLTPTPEGTSICFEMEYHLKTSFMEKALSPLSDRYIKKLSQEILSAIKNRLEEGNKQDL